MKFFFVIDSKKADKDVVEGILNFFKWNANKCSKDTG